MRPSSTTLFIILLGALALGASGCLGGDDDGLRIAVIPKGTTHEFWQAIHAGALQAQHELRAEGTQVTITWNGPVAEDARTDQIDLVNTFIGQGFDGIVLAPLDVNALVPPIEAAVANDVPVVVIDSGVNTDVISSYVATDNEAGGYAGGRYLAEQLGGQGNVILLRYQVGSASTDLREAGFMRAMAEYPGITILSSDQYAGAERSSAIDASETLMTRFGSQVDGVFTPNESSTYGMLQALRNRPAGARAVVHVGFDTAEALVDALEQGQIAGLVVQNPYQMGYQGVRTMVTLLQGGDVPEVIDTGVELVTPGNLNDPAIQALLNPPSPAEVEARFAESANAASE